MTVPVGVGAPMPPLMLTVTERDCHDATELDCGVTVTVGVPFGEITILSVALSEPVAPGAYSVSTAEMPPVSLIVPPFRPRAEVDV